MFDLEAICRKNLGRIRRNLNTPMLYEEIARNREGLIAHLGPVVVRTGQHTARTAEDQYIVPDSASRDRIIWTERNRPYSEEHFTNLFSRLLSYLQNRDLYVQDVFLGADPAWRTGIRVVTETAWHNLYARNLFIQVPGEQDGQEVFVPRFTLLHVPGFQSIPEVDGTRRSAFVVTHLEQQLVIVGGTSYAGEIRQAAHAVVGFLLEQQAVLPLNCSANAAADGSVAVFLGRTGTGKTTLATVPGRTLIGDHQHGWTDRGLFNFDWGCYAKVCGLSRDEESLIHECTRKFGTILENVTIDQTTRRIDFSDRSLTENTRAAYPLPHIPGSSRQGTCGHPRHMFMLTCDAFGVLPPIARLTPEQAVFAGLSAYTSIFPEDARGPGNPEPRFSAYSGASPLGMPPAAYAEGLLRKIKDHQVGCWLLNTGWIGNPHGRGDRIPLSFTRSLVQAAIDGGLDAVEYDTDPIFHFEIPRSCPSLPGRALNPRTLTDDEGDYEVRANRLMTEFIENFDHFSDQVPASVRDMVATLTGLDESLDVMEKIDMNI